MQDLFADNQGQRQVLPLYLALYLLFAPVFGLIVLALSWVIKRYLFFKPPYPVLFVLSLVWALFYVPVLTSTDVSLEREFFFAFWVGTLPLAPLLSATLWGCEWMIELLRPRSLQEQVQEQAKRLEKQSQRLSRTAQREASRPRNVSPGFISLGAFIKGDKFPATSHVRHHNNWLSVADHILPQHMMVVGTTGAGKSVTLTRIVSQVLSATERDVFIIDGKGEEDFALDLANLMYAHGRGVTPIFKLGHGTPGARYNGFCGAAEDIYNRLCALVRVDDAEGDAQYYADLNRDLLQLICYAPAGAPRTFEDVRRRLTKPWLLSAYKHDAEERETIEELDGRALQGLLIRLRPLVREFSPLVGGDGFSLENSRGAVFSLRTQSVGDTARRFLHFLVEDVKDFVGKRQKRPGLLIIDEFGTFDNDNIVKVLSLARSSNLGVILATQDIATLGSEQTRREILANTRTKLLMATDFPEEIAQLAGTDYQIETSIQHEEGESTGVGSARVQHTFKIDMNESARLLPGEAFLIRQRHAAKLKIAQTNGIPRHPQAVARYKIPTKTKAQRMAPVPEPAAFAIPELEM